MAKKKADRKLPCIGIWSLIKTCEPTAGNTLVGLWHDDDGVMRTNAHFYFRKQI